MRLAGLGLRPGDKLEYVYDFGDDIRHVLLLEDIGQPQASAKYPRYREADQGEGKRQTKKKDE